jgi:hypothetical protein
VSTENTAATEVTDTQAQTVEVQAPADKTYTQQEFDDAMAKMRHAVTQKVLKPYQDLGDPDELRTLRQQAEEQRQQEQLKRGEFEKILQEMAAKKDAEIQKREAVIREYKVDTPLLNAAAKYRSVAPEQVKALLKSNVRLGEEGTVEVLGSDGSVRYNDSGIALGVDDLVKEFLEQNPHFVSPTPSTSNTKSSINNSKEQLDVSKLDMSNPEHRKVYAEMKQQRRLNA